MRATDFSWKDSNLGPQELSAVVNFTRPSLSPNLSQPRGFSKGLKGLFLTTQTCLSSLEESASSPEIQTHGP